MEKIELVDATVEQLIELKDEVPSRVLGWDEDTDLDYSEYVEACQVALANLWVKSGHERNVQSLIGGYAGNLTDLDKLALIVADAQQEFGIWEFMCSKQDVHGFVQVYGDDINGGSGDYSRWLYQNVFGLAQCSLSSPSDLFGIDNDDTIKLASHIWNQDSPAPRTEADSIAYCESKGWVWIDSSNEWVLTSVSDWEHMFVVRGHGNCGRAAFGEIDF